MNTVLKTKKLSKFKIKLEIIANILQKLEIHTRFRLKCFRIVNNFD